MAEPTKVVRILRDDKTTLSLCIHLALEKIKRENTPESDYIAHDIEQVAKKLGIVVG